MNLRAGLRLCLLLFALHSFACSSARNYVNPEGPGFHGDFGPVRYPPTDTIKVVAFNIKYGEKVDFAIYELTEVAELRQPEILLLQEMDTEGVETIARRMNYNYVYFPASVHQARNKNFGNAVLSKWPIINYRKIVLPHPQPLNELRRIAVATTILIDTLEVAVYSVHTETIILPRSKRISQADSIVKSLPDSIHYAIVGGDFNTGSGKSIAATEQIFAEAGFRRATKGIGWTMKTGPFGLFRKEFDHIFVRGFKVIAAGKFEETRASDHRPIWTIICMDNSLRIGSSPVQN